MLAIALLRHAITANVGSAAALGNPNEAPRYGMIPTQSPAGVEKCRPRLQCSLWQRVAMAQLRCLRVNFPQPPAVFGRDRRET
jgi:hypothetical protein